MINEHHENHLGGGYPDNLTYTSLHPLSGILKIANEYCMLILKQNVNPVYDHGEAVKIMREREGAYNPKIFEVFLNIFRG